MANLAVDVANADGTAKGTGDATLTPGAQTVTLNIGACQSGARLLVTPQGDLAGGLVLSKAQCTNGMWHSRPRLCFTNYSTTAAAGSVTLSYEVIR